MGKRRSYKWYAVEADDPREVSAWKRDGPKAGVEFWEPAQTVHRLVDGRWEDATSPLLPGYVLARSRGGWSAVSTVVGSRMLCVAGLPRPLEREEVERMMEVERAGKFDPGASMRRGQCVRIRESSSSSFAGMRGRFLELVVTGGGYHARVTLDLEESERTVVVPYDHVEPCRDATERKDASGRSLSSSGGTSTGCRVVPAGA